MLRLFSAADLAVTVGDSLEPTPGELARLTGRIRKGTVRCRAVVEMEGDRRFWDVDASQSACLERLVEFAQRNYTQATGRPPRVSVVMINHIEAGRTLAGSGGGWHRDSFRDQFKAFAYLTDVRSESQGAFCFLPGSNGGVLRLASALHRAVTGGNRYSDRAIGLVLAAGARSETVLLPAGIPFFLNTSAIHRGMPIREGDRVAAAVYMADTDRETYLCELLQSKPAAAEEMRA